MAGEKLSLSEIFAEVLQPYVPEISADNIEIEGYTFDIDKDQIENQKLQLAMNFDVVVTPGHKTRIEFKDIEIDTNTIQALKQALDFTTGYWSTFSQSRVDFCSTEHVLGLMVDQSQLQSGLRRFLGSPS